MKDDRGKRLETKILTLEYQSEWLGGKTENALSLKFVQEGLEDKEAKEENLINLIKLSRKIVNLEERNYLVSKLNEIPYKSGNDHTFGINFHNGNFYGKKYLTEKDLNNFIEIDDFIISHTFNFPNE